MAATPAFRDFVLDLLAGVGASARAMFGGYGLYAEGAMFALIADDTLYFRTDAETQGDFEAAGSAPFRPFGAQDAAMPYHEAPGEALDDPTTALAWARLAIGAARRARSAKPPAKPGAKRSGNPKGGPKATRARRKAPDRRPAGKR